MPTPVEYLDDGATSPFGRWFNRLNREAAAQQAIDMALTRDFKATVKARADRDPGFRKALLARAAQSLLSGETDVGKALLRDYINATVGFQSLGADIAKTPESLMRMLSANGNPRTSNLMEIFEYLQAAEGIRLEVKPRS